MNFEFKADNFSSIALLAGILIAFLGLGTGNFLFIIFGIFLIVFGWNSQENYLRSNRRHHKRRRRKF